MKQSSKGISETVAYEICQIYCELLYKLVTITFLFHEIQKNGQKGRNKSCSEYMIL